MLEQIVLIIDYITAYSTSSKFNKMIDIIQEYVKKSKAAMKDGKVFSGLKVCMLVHKLLLLQSNKPLTIS